MSSSTWRTTKSAPTIMTASVTTSTVQTTSVRGESGGRSSWRGARATMGIVSVCHAAAAEPSGDLRREAREKEGPDHDGVDRRLAEVLLDAPDEVQRADDAGQVRQAMEPLPAREAEAAHGGVRGGERQRHQHHERRRAGEDELALDDVVDDCGEVESLIEDGVREHVQRRVERGEEPEDPPQPDRPRPAEEALRRRAGERRRQQDQRDEPELV